MVIGEKKFSKYDHVIYINGELTKNLKNLFIPKKVSNLFNTIFKLTIYFNGELFVIRQSNLKKV